MILKEVFDKTVVFFKQKNIESARLDTEFIFAHALGLERIQLYLNFERPLTEDELNRSRELIRRRVNGEPIAYLLGYKHFFTSKFFVSEHTLIPRPETECLVEEILNRTDQKDISLNILDIGTGTGCIGLSLVQKLSQAQLVALDVSAKALEVFEKNRVALQLEERSLSACLDACDSNAVDDWFSQNPNVESKFDIIAGNPPYIDFADTEVEANVKKFEPATSLFSADQGLHHIKAWAKIFSSRLKPKGLMIFEHGYLQGPAAAEIFSSLGVFQEVRVIKDLSGHDRFTLGVCHG